MTWQRSGNIATECSSLAISAVGRGVAEDRQAEGGLGDEQVAGDGSEGGAGRVGLALVVAGIDDARRPRCSITTWAEPSTWPAGASQTVTSPSAMVSP